MTRHRVLIVEDEMIVQMHLRRIVEALGHEVVGTAASAHQAVLAAERRAPELVLMDIRLAEGGDGVETARVLGDRFGCAVLFITAHADAETVKRTVPVGAAGYLVKPFSDAGVQAAIATALTGHGRLQRARRRERSLASALVGLTVEEMRTEDTPTTHHAPFGTDTRLLVYSHDTFGLGHLRRCLNLVRGLVRRHPDLSTLMVTGSPVVHRFPMPKGTDYLKLPAVRKVAPERYESRSLSMSDSGIRTLRSNLLLRAARDYKPNVLIVDHAPIGMRGELVATLEWLKSQGRCTRILGLRDVIDEPRTVTGLWNELGIYDVLSELYDHVAVYGSRTIYDAVEEYRFPADVAAKTRYVHYVVDESDATTLEAGEPGRAAEPPLVVVSAGGGDGGLEGVSSFLAMMRAHCSAIDFRAVIVTGPLVPAHLERRFREEALGLPVVVKSFLSSPAALFRKAELVVSTAGYNTVAELLKYAKRALVVPRVLHRREQLIRARRMEELGLVTCLTPDEVSPDRLFEEIRRMRGTVDEPLTRGREMGTVPMDGTARFASFCSTLQVAAGHCPGDAQERSVPRSSM